MATSSSSSSFISPILSSSIFIILLFCNEIAASQSIIESLPGFNGSLPFFLETGYIGVGKMDEMQLFYYFIESERSPESDPVILWLTGGPGASGLSALFYQFGPLMFNYKDSNSKKIPVLELNPYSWTKVASIIFLDAPVGTGFSYATTLEAYNVSDTISAAKTYEFLGKWLVGHPQFLANPLYIGADSYSGMVAPIVVQEILNGKEMGLQPPINLRGYLLGNPYTHYKIDINSRVPFAFGMALLSKNIYESFKTNCKGEYAYPNPNNTLCMVDIQIINECIRRINNGQILENQCSKIFSPISMAPGWDTINIREDNSIDDGSLLSLSQVPQLWCRQHNYAYCIIWANDKTVREALHIRQDTIKEWKRFNRTLSYSKNVNNSIGYHQNFTKTGLQVLIYSGDHDMIFPYVGTQEWIESLNLTISIDWRPWFVDGQVGGYSVEYKYNDTYDYRLTFATVKGGGHTAPEYRPKECLAMVHRFLAVSPL